jgi:hypothetical protein
MNMLTMYGSYALKFFIQVRILFPSQSLTKQADSEKANEKAADREEVAAA